jgi:hypothetical protein
MDIDELFGNIFIYEELLPCPFCGKPFVIREKEQYETIETIAKRYSIGCFDHGCPGRWIYSFFPSSYLKEIVEKSNHRV